MFAQDKRKWYSVRPAYMVVFFLALAFTLVTCTPKFVGMVGKTGVKPSLKDGAYDGKVVSYGENKYLVLVDVNGQGYVEFRINAATADDIMQTVRMGAPGMYVHIRIGDEGDLTEWLWTAGKGK